MFKDMTGLWNYYILICMTPLIKSAIEYLQNN